MTPDPRLLAHPVVYAEAERLAAEVDEVLVLGGEVFLVEAFAVLLSDPSRPETCDYLIRSGAAADTRWGVAMSETPPVGVRFYVVRLDVENEDPRLRGSPRSLYFRTRDKADLVLSKVRLNHWRNLDPADLAEEWLAVHGQEVSHGR